MHLFAVLFVLLSWWFSTGVLLLVIRLPRQALRFTLLGTSVLALGGLCGLSFYSRLDSRWAAYAAFSCALAVWSWHELTFLLGIVTGPRKTACPTEARGWRRFVYATEVVIHHEIALALTMLAVAAVTWREPNQVGTFTFLVLWTMRLSAKLNLFLGVRNLTTEFIPTHLRYLLSYFPKARLNPLMPLSILIGSAVTIRLFIAAQATTASMSLGQTLVGTLLGLAVLEHLFLALPLPDAMLWRWALRRGAEQQPKS